MRAFVRNLLAFAIVGFAAVVSGRALAQPESAPAATAPAEQPEEVTVRGRRTLTEYRLELEEAREEMIEIFNEENSGERNDVTCRDEQPTGTRMRHSVCRSNAEQEAASASARGLLDSLFRGSGAFRTNTPNPPPGGVPVNTVVNTGEAQADGVIDGEEAQAAFEKEMERLMAQSRRLYRAVTKYVELEEEYNQARGASGQGTE